MLHALEKYDIRVWCFNRAQGKSRDQLKRYRPKPKERIHKAESFGWKPKLTERTAFLQKENGFCRKRVVSVEIDRFLKKCWFLQKCSGPKAFCRNTVFQQKWSLSAETPPSAESNQNAETFWFNFCAFRNCRDRNVSAFGWSLAKIQWCHVVEWALLLALDNNLTPAKLLLIYKLLFEFGLVGQLFSDYYSQIPPYFWFILHKAPTLDKHCCPWIDWRTKQGY